MDEMILSLGTSVPPNKYNQSEIAERTIKPLNLTGRLNQWMNRVSSLSGINSRYSVLTDYNQSLKKGHFFGHSFPQKEPSMTDRMTVYEKEAPKLALNAAKEAISNWGEDANKITHVISVSCTGFFAPGIEVILMKELGLNQNVHRLGINFMGCMAAFNALTVAQSLASENPENRVLVVCTELTTIHYHGTDKKETLLGHLLFGDGAACAIIGAQPTERETPLWRFEKKSSWLIEDTMNEMSWKSGDLAYVMHLTSKVPKVIKKKIKALMNNFISKDKSDDMLWAIHPGGKAIIGGIADSLELSDQQTTESRQVLENYGNMSSSSILFVLNLIKKRRHEKKWTCALGFGPGLCVESLLLENMAAA